MDLVPPPGIDPNADIKQTIIIPIIALVILATISVVLRIVSRLTVKVAPQLDDYLIYVALMVGWGQGAVSIFACYRGAGRHIWNPTVQLEAIIKVIWASQFLYDSVIPLTKFSIIVFYYKLFPDPFFRKVLYCILFLVFSWWITALIVPAVECQPYSYLWDQYVDPTAIGRCINLPAFYIGTGSASVVTDFIILMAPIPVVWNLQMPITRKLSVLGIFLLGGFACIAGAVRLHVIRELTTSGDLSWNMSQTLVWSSIEPSIGIICACLPTIGPLIRRFLPKWFGGSSLKPSSRPAYGTDSRRPHSRNGGFYALHSRTKDPHKNKSDDELGLRNDIKSDHDHQPQDRSKDSMAFDSQNAIIVKRDIEWSSTSVFS